MIYIENEKITGQVIFQHNFPFHEEHGLRKTQEELEQSGMLVESIPERPDEMVGKNLVLYANPLRWEYEDRPLTQEEKLQQMVDAGTITQEQMDDLLGG